jgi:hypothetical protein
MIEKLFLVLKAVFNVFNCRERVRMCVCVCVSSVCAYG